MSHATLPSCLRCRHHLPGPQGSGVPAQLGAGHTGGGGSGGLAAQRGGPLKPQRSSALRSAAAAGAAAAAAPLLAVPLAALPSSATVPRYLASSSLPRPGLTAPPRLLPCSLVPAHDVLTRYPFSRPHCPLASPNFDLSFYLMRQPALACKAAPTQARMEARAAAVRGI